MKTNDNILNPLLDQNLTKECQYLDEENSIFNTSIDSISKELDTKSISDETNISQLINKLNNIKSHMERINSKIQYLKNYLKDGTNENQLAILNKIKTVSENISKKYESVNKKFTNKIENAKKKIELEIESEGVEIEIGGGVVQTLQTLQTSTQITQNNNSKTRIAIERLRERQEDLEKIYKISYQLLELSRSMKRSAENQERLTSSIEDHLIITDKNINGANEQLNKKSKSQSTNNKLCFWVFTILLIIIVIAIVMIYWKYYRLNNIKTGIF